MANQQPQSRQSLRKSTKQKKINSILNIAIAVVFILIIVVGWTVIFAPDDSQKTAGTDNESKTTNVQKNETSKNGNTKKFAKDQVSEEGKNSSTDEEESSSSEENVTEVQTNDSNVIKAVINSNWEPVGTSQTGEHVTQYDEGSTDWQEMLKAISVATGTTTDDMTVLWIGNGGNPNKNVVGTIKTKDSGSIYKVYLEWVDGQGWKPTKLEQLKEFKQ